MRWNTLRYILLLSIISSIHAEWSWGGEKNEEKNDKLEEKSSGLLEGEETPEAQEKISDTNSTVLDDIVDELVSSKQGRSLGGFDDVYSDPTIKEALDAGDDSEARNLIKGRLCTLGLIQCDEDNMQEKRFVSPDELIYAQPVDIQPIGKPIPSIPIRGPPRAYGPAKPMPYPSRLQKIPPKRVGYSGNYRPGFSDKYGSSGSIQFGQNNGLYGGSESNYVTKQPIYANDNPYTFDTYKPGYNKAPIPSKQDTTVQQHVHHHYVHSDGDKDPKVIIKPVAIPVGSVGHLTSSIQQQPTDVITAGEDYSAIHSSGFKPMSGGYSFENKPNFDTDTIYGTQYGYNKNKGNGNLLNQGLPNHYSNNPFEEKYGNSLGAYASQNNEFYKKEIHVGAANNLYNQGPATFSQGNNYQDNYHEAKAQGFECICVNYDQCPSQEIIGRRDDLYLPIDPRNKESDITALNDDQIDNITKINVTSSDKSVNNTSTDADVKKVSKREAKEQKPEDEKTKEAEPRQGYFGRPQQQCKPSQVCCRRPLRPQAPNHGQCGIRNSQGVNGRIKTPSYVDGDSEFGEYPWQAAILKKDPKESVYVCGGTLIDGLHIITAAHCIKSYKGYELRVRLGEWDVNHDVEFYPYIERDVVSVHVHPLYYAGTLDNDLAILKLDHPVEWTKYPHISPACLPDKYTDYAGQRCWTTGWGKDAFGDYGKYQNILKEVDVPVLPHGLCQQQLRQTRLGYNYELNPGFVCAGGEEGKDACKGDGGGPLVCERGGTWQLVGVVSWGIGCGQPGVPGVYVKVAHYLDWISQVTGKFSPY